ncbi:MAG: dioxygenase, partial [Acidobacteriota bacterium]
PVIQLSLDRRQTGAFHLEIGRALAPLREEGVLILGSGNLVHNLGSYRWNDPASPAFDWAASFEQWARAAILQRDFDGLANWERLGSPARLAVPTPEHYLPLLSVLGASDDTDRIDFPVEGFEGGSISMLAVKCAAV